MHGASRVIKQIQVVWPIISSCISLSVSNHRHPLCAENRRERCEMLSCFYDLIKSVLCRCEGACFIRLRVSWMLFVYNF